jgi:hypothetical protein
LGVKMKKYVSSIFLALLFVVFIHACAAIGTVNMDDYGLLGSAATSCASVTIGVYADAIPDDLSREKLLSACKNQIPENYFAVLKKYPSDVQSKGSYYLLRIFDLDNKDLIMFHYSCSSEPGRVIAQPGKYDINNLDLYDTCKKN